MEAINLEVCLIHARALVAACEAEDFPAAEACVRLVDADVGKLRGLAYAESFLVFNRFCAENEEGVRKWFAEHYEQIRARESRRWIEGYSEWVRARV